MKDREAFIKYLYVTEQYRPGYKHSVGFAPGGVSFGTLTPKVELYSIYSLITGTPSDLDDQKLFDFIPGYKIMTLEDIAASLDRFENKGLVPFLSNYSGDFMCVYNDAVVSVLHDDPAIVEYSSSVGSFFLTVISMYEEGVFFVGGDGYLDYDFDRELIVGKRLNPNSSYWNYPV